ncbi:MAG: hypothetical protein GY757_42220 [bacterium]|nr:hypothetical protein [bacterium]
MLTENPGLIILFLLALAGIYFLVFTYLEKRRREGLQNVAGELGLTYTPNFDDNAGLLRFKLFNKGSSRKANNLLSGKFDGHTYKIFDYKYTIRHSSGAKSNSSTYRQTVAYVNFKEKRLAGFLLGPERFFHKIGTTFGMQDIDFEDSPGFSKHYLLQGENEEEIRAFFKPALLEYFREKKITATIESQGNKLILFKKNKRIKPKHIAAFLTEFREIVTHLLIR